MVCLRIIESSKCDEINISLMLDCEQERTILIVLMIMVDLCRSKYEVLTLDSSGIALNEEALCGEVTN